MTEAHPAMDEDLELVGTFLAAFYHERDDIVGTTRALQTMLGKFEYRRDLAYGFKRLMEYAPATTLVHLVRESANRNAESCEEAFAYLLEIFERNLFHYDLDDGDEIRPRSEKDEV